MKLFKSIILIAVLLCSANAVAQERNDSCFVYGYLRWSPSLTKYSAKLQMGPDDDLTDVLSDNGEKLKFHTFLNAVNYMSMTGWEILEISPVNPDKGTFVKEQYAIIRKLMPKADAAKYSNPKK